MPYSNEEYWEMVRVYARSNDSVRGAINLYREMFPNRRVPSYYVMLSVNQRLREFGQFTVPAHAQGRGRQPYPVRLQEDILEYFEENPQASTRNAARRFGVSQYTVWNVLHQEGLHPYHFRPVQELGPNDLEPRVIFCRWFLQNHDKNILFTDEATFTRLGIFNVHNEHWWSHSNPHVTRQDAYQHRFSVNVWAGVLNNCLLGPYFIEGRLDSQSYLTLLRSVVNDMLEDVPIMYLRDLYYQHDGAPAHYQSQVREFLNNHFQNHWIGRGGPVAWPARSPDLTPLDFYLWGEVKRLVYATEYSNRDELKSRIRAAFDKVRSDPFVLNRVKDNMRKRAELCITREGEHFEQWLRFV